MASTDLETKLRETLARMGYQATRYVYPPGTHFPPHTHGVDKIDAVVEGTFELVVEGVRHVLGPGQWARVPKGVVHEARVLGDRPVVSLDAVRRRG